MTLKNIILDMTQQTSEQVNFNRNPIGKGGFLDNPQHINHGGRPKNQQSFTYWLNYFKNLTVKEFQDWPKKNTKESRTMASEIAWKRIFNSTNSLHEFKEIADRTEGKPLQTTNLLSEEREIREPLIISTIEPRNIIEPDSTN